MISLPPVLSPNEVGDRLGKRIVVRCTDSVRQRLRSVLSWPFIDKDSALPSDIDGFIVAGGGQLIDDSKLLRAERPHLKLAALPTVWGSGAEASPIALRNTPDGKQIHFDPALRPDFIISMPELGSSVPEPYALYACGDTWAHALEGFLSPLATNELRADLAAVMKRMMELPLAYDARWFELSALACAGQALSSVGAVHGIAHVIESKLGPGWGHARLCSLLLLPVMTHNQAHSPKWPLLAENGIDTTAIFNLLRQLFDTAAYALVFPTIEGAWMKILRDPCTRTNSALVRPSDLAFFANFSSP